MWAEIAKLLRRLPWWPLLLRRRIPNNVVILPQFPPASDYYVEHPADGPLGTDEGPEPPVAESEPWHPDPGYRETDREIVERLYPPGWQESVQPESEPDGSPDEPMPPKRTVPWTGGTRGKYDTLTGKTREAIDEIASLILDRFDALSIRGTASYTSRRSLMVVEELLGNDFYLASPELRAAMQGGGKYSPGHFDTTQDHAELAEMAWPLNMGTVSYYTDDDTIALFQAISTTPEEVRGRARLAAQYMAELRIGVFGANGAWTAWEMVVGLIGKKWVRLDAGMESRFDNINVGPMTWRDGGTTGTNTWVHDFMSTAVARQLECRYQWHVAFGGRKHGLRIVLPTNPNGALKLFKDREITVGKSRREALRHWVEHFIRDDEEHGSVYVRDHLRGHTQFVWNEMETELMVSAYDLEKNDAFKNEAQHWRATRKHNRVRVRLKRSKHD